MLLCPESKLCAMDCVTIGNAGGTSGCGVMISIVPMRGKIVLTNMRMSGCLVWCTLLVA
jgi:hypothetical protein